MKTLLLVLATSSTLASQVSAQATQAEVKYNKELDGFQYPFEI